MKTHEKYKLYTLGSLMTALGFLFVGMYLPSSVASILTLVFYLKSVSEE